MNSNLKRRLTAAFAPLPEPAHTESKPQTKASLRNAISDALAEGRNGFHDIQAKKYEVKVPELMAGVLPDNVKSPLLAMDNVYNSYTVQDVDFTGFPGYSQLAMLATRAEYRAMASAMSTELTREWITLTSSETSGDETRNKVTELSKKLEELNIQQLFADAAMDDCLFGRAQIAVIIDKQQTHLPLVLSDKTIRKDAKVWFRKVEPMWTTPVAFNANDPFAPDFYCPSRWFVMGKDVHASRLLTIVTRPVPDVLKPAFNFSGMSLSQLAEPYVNNWLRTRQSVSDLINNFSIIALKTNMGTLMQNARGLIDRIRLFTVNRSNNGLMVLDTQSNEDIASHSVPLSGLDKLQAQAQEQMCAVSRMPAVVLTGLSPTGLNASSDGEIRVFYDWIHAQQEAHWRKSLQTILNILQYVMYGGIDEDINFSFDPLYQMTPKELAEIKKSEADVDAVYLDRQVIDAQEARERLARDHKSGYQGLELNKEIVEPVDENDDDLAEDSAFNEADHPRDEHGKFSESVQQSLSVANKLGYSVKFHKDEDSFTKASLGKVSSSGSTKNLAGFANSENREIHIKGTSGSDVRHTLHHEVGHILDFANRNVDVKDKAKVIQHKNRTELKKLADYVYGFGFKFVDKAESNYYRSSLAEVMAEVYAMYKEQPAILKMAAPTTYNEIESAIQKLG